MAVVNRVFETGCIVGMKENLYVAFDLGWCLALSISPSLCVCVCVCVMLSEDTAMQTDRGMSCRTSHV